MEDFRGIVDDLSVENRGLKRRLKQYERMDEAHLKEEKLFEVRMHGLPVAKRGELEDTLQKFVLGLDEERVYDSLSTTDIYDYSGSGFRTQRPDSCGSRSDDLVYTTAFDQGLLDMSGSSNVCNESVESPANLWQRDDHAHIQDTPQGMPPRPLSATAELAKQRTVPVEYADLPYQPILSRHNNTESDITSSSEENMVKLAHVAFPAKDQSLGMTNPGLHARSVIRNTTTRRNLKRAKGTIAFYKNARFCTDLDGSCDMEALMSHNQIMCNIANTPPLGSSNDHGLYRNLQNRSPWKDTKGVSMLMDSDSKSTQPALDTIFLPQVLVTSESITSPFGMEVSGLGGVFPADNFVVNVQSRHYRVAGVISTNNRSVPGRYIKRLTGTLMKNRDSRKGLCSFHREVVSAHRRDLPPSELPPASYYNSADMSDSDDELDDKSYLSVAHGSPGALLPHLVPQLFRMS